MLALGGAAGALTAALMAVGMLMTCLVEMVVVMGMDMVVFMRMVMGVAVGHAVMGMLMGVGMGMFVAVANVIVMNVHTGSPLGFSFIIADTPLLVKLQFIVLFKSAQPGNNYLCHCEARRAVAISW